MVTYKCDTCGTIASKAARCCGMPMMPVKQTAKKAPKREAKKTVKAA